MKSTTAARALILLSVLGILYAPFVLIWALNTLFNLGIPKNLTTWGAVLVLLVLFTPKK
jgi:hypothetical protein